MAGIEQAAKWMRDGKIVTRKDQEWSYRASQLGELLEYINHDGSVDDRSMLQVDDVLATDWEIADA